MALIGARIAEGLGQGTVNSKALQLQQALMDIATRQQREDAETAFGRQQQLNTQRSDLNAQSVIDELALHLGVEPTREAVQGGIAKRTGEENTRRKQSEAEARTRQKRTDALDTEDRKRRQGQEDADRAAGDRRTSLQELAIKMDVGERLGRVPAHTTADGQLVQPVVPVDVEEMLPGVGSFASGVRKSIERAASTADALPSGTFDDTDPTAAGLLLRDPEFRARLSGSEVMQLVVRSAGFSTQGTLSQAEAMDVQAKAAQDMETLIMARQYPGGLPDGFMNPDARAAAVQDITNQINTRFEDEGFIQDFQLNTGWAPEEVMPRGGTQVMPQDLAAFQTAPTGLPIRTAAPNDAQSQLRSMRADADSKLEAGQSPQEVAEGLRRVAQRMRDDPTTAASMGAPEVTPDQVDAMADAIHSGGLVP